MKVYKATISADRYPMDFRVTASDWPTATARAVRLWKQRFKRSRADTLKITITLLGEATDGTQSN